MSEHSKRWPQPVIVDLTETLEGVRAQARAAGNQQYVRLAGTYISALSSMTPHLSRWLPDPLITAGFIRAAAVVGELYREGNIRGVLQQSYRVLSALPGDPGSIPPEVPLPPDDSDD